MANLQKQDNVDDPASESSTVPETTTSGLMTKTTIASSVVQASSCRSTCESPEESRTVISTTAKGSVKTEVQISSTSSSASLSSTSEKCGTVTRTLYGKGA